jgi:hypothetical protein
MRKISLLSVVFLLLFLACSRSANNPAGTTIETDATMIFNPNGSPAVGAQVRFFQMLDSTGVPVKEVSTDSHGHYSIKGLLVGNYSMVARKDSLIVFQDSLIVLAETAYVKPDTLQSPGVISGVISLMPRRDPRVAQIRILGTDIFSNADENGWFRLTPVARGRYHIRASCTPGGYIPAHADFYASLESRDTLGDTLRLINSEIALVTGVWRFALPYNLDTTINIVLIYESAYVYKINVNINNVDTMEDRKSVV